VTVAHSSVCLPAAFPSIHPPEPRLGPSHGGPTRCTGPRERASVRLQAYGPNTPRTPHHSLRIYIYELPVALNRVGLYHGLLGLAAYDAIYVAYQKFLAALLSDWSVRTEDPYEATMFYVPALTYVPRRGGGQHH
jgi:hypothetical protein